MPLQPVTGTLHLPLDGEKDVWALFEVGGNLGREPDAVRRQAIGRDLTDHFFYLGAVRPEWMAWLRTEWFRLDDKILDDFALGFAEWIPLLTGAEDADVDRLADALDRHPSEPRLTMLAAVGTPHADDRLALLARRHGWAESLAKMGIAVPASGPARRRFTVWKRAVRKIPFEGS